MSTHKASCRCGQLKAVATGDPVRVSVCHCLNCKKRSGSAFAAQVRFPAERVTFEGRSSSHVMRGDSGNPARFHFCPECGTDVYYVIEGKFDGLVAIPLGTFEDPFAFPEPQYSVYENRKYDWVQISGETIEHN